MRGGRSGCGSSFVRSKGGRHPHSRCRSGCRRRICQPWAYQYNKDGLAGLDDQWGTSRSSLPIPTEQMEQLCERLAAGPLPGIRLRRYGAKSYNGFCLPSLV